MRDQASVSDSQLEGRHATCKIGESDMTLKQIKPHLGDPVRKERVTCNDCKMGYRAEMFGKPARQTIQV